MVLSRTIGHHTGQLIGEDLVRVITKFQFGNKLGWLIGDNVPVNDVAVRYVCKALDPDEERLEVKEIRGRCIEHTIHLMASHFVSALQITSLHKAKQRIHGPDYSDGEVDEYDEEFDVEISVELEASENDVDAIRAASTVTFDAGDVVGKLMAFISQLRMCGEDTRDFLKQLAVSNGCPTWEIKLWVRTRWGSLSDCFRVMLALQKAIDYFCILADENDTIPPLSGGKKWSDYKLSSPEWQIIKLAQNCLQILAKTHGELSANKTATCHKVFPLLEILQSRWETLCKDDAYAPVKHALEAGLKNMQKWYRKTDDTSIYFISHVLDPTRKLRYIEAAWEEEWVTHSRERMREIYLKYRTTYNTLKTQLRTSVPKPPPLVHHNSMTDDWMDQFINNAVKTKSHASTSRREENENLFEELDRFFMKPTIPRHECLDVISWWGDHQQYTDFPILRLMARDYIAIPGSTCLAERSFSMSARTDDVRRRQMGDVKFGGLQRLRSAYQDGRLQAVKEAWTAVDPDFNFEVDSE
ncbi:Ribonuclease H-like domain containing protein [Amanita muscaria]